MSLTLRQFKFDTELGEKTIDAVSFVEAIKKLAKKHHGITVWALISETSMSPEGGRA